MKRLNVDITDELKEVLEELAVTFGHPIGAIVERILRDNDGVDATRQLLKLKWTDRPPTGRPPKKS